MINSLVAFRKNSWIYSWVKNKGCSLANARPFLLTNRTNLCSVSCLPGPDHFQRQQNETSKTLKGRHSGFPCDCFTQHLSKLSFHRAQSSVLVQQIAYCDQYYCPQDQAQLTLTEHSRIRSFLCWVMLCWVKRQNLEGSHINNMWLYCAHKLGTAHLVNCSLDISRIRTQLNILYK